MMVDRTVAVTGGAGKVAARTRPYLLKRWSQLRLTDLVEPANLDPGETFVRADLTDLNAIRHAIRCCRAVIHFGGHPREADWETILTANIEGTRNLFEAARLEQVERVVFASSNHAVGFRSAADLLPSNAAPRPDGLYGVSKAFGEALATLYADKHGLRCLSIRIGSVSDAPQDKRRLSIWLHPEDLAQLVAIGVEHPDLHAETVYGVSATATPYYDDQIAVSLGYRPKHNADDFAGSICPPSGKDDPVAARFMGGPYSAMGFDGDVERTQAAVRMSPGSPKPDRQKT